MNGSTEVFESMIQTVKELERDIDEIRSRVDKVKERLDTNKIIEELAVEIFADELERIQQSLISGIEQAILTSLEAERNFQHATNSYALLASESASMTQSNLRLDTWPRNQNQQIQPPSPSQQQQQQPSQNLQQSQSQVNLKPNGNIPIQSPRAAPLVMAREELSASTKKELTEASRDFLEQTFEDQECLRETLLHLIREAGNEAEKIATIALKKTDITADELRRNARALVKEMRKLAVKKLKKEAETILSAAVFNNSSGFLSCAIAEATKRAAEENGSIKQQQAVAIAHDCARKELQSLISKALLLHQPQQQT